MGVTGTEGQKSTLEPLTERETAILKGEEPDAAGQAGQGEAASSVEVAAGQKPVGEAKERATAEGGTEAAAASPQPEPEKSAAPEWITDDVLTLAASYGMSAEDLADFQDASEFTRAGRLFDRALTSRHKVAEAQEPVAPKPPAGKDETGKISPAEKVELDPEKWAADGYDENTVTLVKYAKGLRGDLDAVRAQAEQFMAFQQKLEQQRLYDAFDQVVDGLDPKLYGRFLDPTGPKLTQAQSDNRVKLWKQAGELQAVLKAASPDKENPPMPVLVQRAHQMAFAEELRKQDRERLREQIAAQAQRRRPVPVRPKPVADGRKGKDQSDEDPAKVIANHPEVVKFWEQAVGTSA